MKKKTSFFVAVIFVLAFPLPYTPGSEGILNHGLGKDKKTLRTLLPDETESVGWKSVTDPEFFGQDNLWEYINGQAEMYLDYGFRLVVTTEYRSMDGSGSMIIEIYQMESPKHAFGIYAAERSPSDNFIKIGVQGYLEENVLNFWKGHYYVKLTSFQVSSETKEIIVKLAGVIAKKIKGVYSEPELFACFPEKNRVKMSERFIPMNFLGQPYLNNGYRVEYENGGSNYQVFLVKNGSSEEAKKAFRKYRSFLISQNEKPSPIRENDYDLIFTKGEKGKAIFQFGPFLGGVLNTKDLSQAERIIAEMVRNIS